VTPLCLLGSVFTIGIDIFIARYDPDGALVWARSVGGSSSSDYGFGIAALSDGSVFVTGSFQEEVTFGEGNDSVTLTSVGGSDIFVTKYHPDGKLAWARRAGGSYEDPYGNMREAGFHVVPLPDGSVLVSGFFSEAATFGEEPNLVELLSAGETDGFIARYLADGTFSWATGVGGVGEDAVGSIGAMPDGSLLVAGTFEETVTFGEGASSIAVTSAGGIDAFVAKYLPPLSGAKDL
jgi:hypothetical protein